MLTSVKHIAMPIPLMILGILPCMSVCNAAHAQTLNETIQLALQHQSDLKVSTLQLADQEASVTQAEAQTGIKLNVRGEAGLGYVSMPAGALFPEAGSRQPRTLELQASYPIYTAGRSRIGVDVAQANTAASTATKESIKTQVCLDAITIYSAMIKDKALINLAKETQVGLDRAVTDSKKRLNVGEVTKTDVAQTLAQQAQGLGEQTRAISQLKADQAHFLTLTGVNPTEKLEEITPPEITFNQQQALVLVEQTPEIQAAKAYLNSAMLQAKLAGLSLKPSIMLMGHASSSQGSDFLTDRIGSYGISVQANLPILDGGINQAERKRAALQVAIAEEKLNGLKTRFKERILQDFIQLETAKAQATALEQTVNAAVLARDTIRKEMDLGARTFFELLVAERTVRDAKTQLTLNQQAQIVTSYQLLADVGKLP